MCIFENHIIFAHVIKRIIVLAEFILGFNFRFFHLMGRQASLPFFVKSHFTTYFVIVLRQISNLKYEKHEKIVSLMDVCPRVGCIVGHGAATAC